MNHALGKIRQMRLLKIILLIIGVVSSVYFIGPKQDKPLLKATFPSLTDDLKVLEEQINQKERGFRNMKQDNESRIIWFDSAYTRTSYSLVYLPGFSASYMEGFPVNLAFARRYGCNVFFPRLHEHGLYSSEALLHYNGDSLMADMVNALAVGNRIGEKVILMATSTGGTFALKLAADFPEKVAGIILFSPNIAIASPFASLISGPWGLQLLRTISGSKYRYYEASDLYKRYWITSYRLEALTALQAILDQTMDKALFEKVTQPLFLGYYYKSDEEQDKVVSVPAMRKMFNQLGTPAAYKRAIAFPDAGNHVVCSFLTSASIPEVQAEVNRFAEEVLGMQSVQ